MAQQPNMQQMLKQVQKMQADMVAAQEALKDEVVEVSSGGGMVTVKVSGELVVQSITIDPQAVDPDDVEMLSDMVLAAVNEGLRKAQDLAAERLGAVTGGLGGPAASAVSGCPASEQVHPPPIQRLITELSKLPGVGGRTAQRLTFHLLRASDEDAFALADAIRDVKLKITFCEICFNLADGPRCRICQDERRDNELICVVEEPADVISIERTHEFGGRYHVLGGALSPIDGIDPEDLKIEELYARVADPARSVREVVIATNPTTTGEATAMHLAAGIRRLAPEIAVTRLASGLPVGADLEYADELTLGRAFAGRRAV